MKYWLFLLALLSTPDWGYAQTGNLTPHKLRCEYLDHPLAVDAVAPRLSWKLNGEGGSQTAFRVTVSHDSLTAARGQGEIWDSGKRHGNTTLLAYNGPALRPRTDYYWRVTSWGDGKTAAASSPVARFRTGVMHDHWQGAWITDSRDVDLEPAAYFRKEFAVGKELKSAHLYIAAGGLHEVYLNGTKVGDHLLDPAFTRFDARVLYVTHDVTDLVQEHNAVSVLLGNGWYNHQATAVWYFHEAVWRARPRFCLDLRLEYTDGSTETVATDKSWKTAPSPVVYNSIYAGEAYDATRALPGYNEAGFDDSGWAASFVVQAPADKISSQQMHPIRKTAEITPTSVRKINDRKYLVDLGRNIAGVTELTVTGPAQTVIEVTHAELLDSAGNLDLANIDLHYRPAAGAHPFQTDIYTLSGEGVETFSPRFNYKGFQYVEITSSEPLEITRQSIKGIVLHSDVPQVGHIRSSDSTLNKLWEATNNSYLANLFGYPTDCPQREKNGWTGDAHIASETGLYNFDAITVYEKWLADHQDEQQPNGTLPAIIPSSGWGYQWANGPDWTSSLAIIPWNVYLFYGDSRLLESVYPNLRRYVERIRAVSKNNLTDWGLGDWIPVKTKTPVEFTSSVYYFIDATILAEAARIKGHAADAERYGELAVAIRRAINDKYYDAATGSYANGSQTALSMALHWGIVPQASTDLVAQRLAERVVDGGKHIDVGLLGSKTILNALSDNGYADLAYEVASQDTYPSWGWWIANGLGTLPENWSLAAEKNDISHNHVMFGEISAWYFKALGGIKPDPRQPGFGSIILEPHFVAALDAFEATYASPRGTITSAWKREGGKLNYLVVVPPNCTASLRLEARHLSPNVMPFVTQRGDGFFALELPAGRYEMRIEEED